MSYVTSKSSSFDNLFTSSSVSVNMLGEIDSQRSTLVKELQKLNDLMKLILGVLNAGELNSNISIEFIEGVVREQIVQQTLLDISVGEIIEHKLQTALNLQSPFTNDESMVLASTFVYPAYLRSSEGVSDIDTILTAER